MSQEKVLPTDISVGRTFSTVTELRQCRYASEMNTGFGNATGKTIANKHGVTPFNRNGILSVTVEVAHQGTVTHTAIHEGVLSAAAVQGIVQEVGGTTLNAQRIDTVTIPVADQRHIVNSTKHNRVTRLISNDTVRVVVDLETVRLLIPHCQVIETVSVKITDDGERIRISHGYRYGGRV